MLVSLPRVQRLQTSGLRAVAGLISLLLAAVLAQLTVAGPASASAAALSSKVLAKRTEIVAPKTGVALSGTLKGVERCGVLFPGATRSVRISVTGPLRTTKRSKKSKTKVKTRTLKTRVLNGTRKRHVTCTWKTTAAADGRYRFTVRARVRSGGAYRAVTLKRAVTVRNRATSLASGSGTPQLGVGNTRFIPRLESQWDSWISAAGTARQSWMRQHMWRVVGHSGFFDRALSWAPPSLAYKDLYAIYRGDNATLGAHPEWVLKGGAGQRMAIPWGCNPGPCPQFAGDIGSPSFRAHWIADARSLIQRGYRGLWIDDANIEMRIGDAKGNEQAPIDPRTGTTMTFSDWRRYIAEFLEQIRRELPSAEITANVLWFGGTAIGRDSDAYVRRAYTAVDRLNLERGFNDSGLTNGSEPRDIWSVDAFMAFIDRMHDRGVPVTLDAYGTTQATWEYNLAGYFLVDRGDDAVGEGSLKPGDWWSGWDVQLGQPAGARTRGADGVYRRSFQRGLVLLNAPRGADKTVTLPAPMRRIDGTLVSSVTLAPGSGVVLLAN